MKVLWLLEINIVNVGALRPVRAWISEEDFQPTFQFETDA
jgi:hypothetical protein